MVPLNLKTIQTTAKETGKALIKAAPTLGVIFGVSLMAGGAVKTGMETPQMMKELEALDAKQGLSHKDYLKEKAKILAKHLGIPAALLLSGSAMIFAGYKIKYTQAAIAAAALASKTEEAEKLEQKIIEKYGPKEYEKMKDEMIKDDVKAHPINYSTVINTGHGNTLCYDVVLHDYYWSDLDFIRKIVDQINKEMIRTRWGMRKSAVSYDTFREYQDLPLSNEHANFYEPLPNGVQIGKDLGWYNCPIELRIVAIQLPDDTICHAIGFSKAGAPKWHLNLEDSNGEDAQRLDYELDDDETDMKWRGN